MSLKVCVCGGGNGAHTLSGLSASREGVEVRVLTLFADEAERWTKAMEEVGGLTVLVTEKDGTTTEIKSKPHIVTKDPKIAVTGADVIILTVPAFAHEGYFKAMVPYIQDSALLVGLPGQAGFEFQCRDILGTKAAAISILTFETLPWACRIKEFGKVVEVLGTKAVIAAALVKGTAETKDPLSTLQMLLGAEPKLRLAKHFLEMLIMNHSFIHPCIMNGEWKNWDGKPVAQPPLFYQGISKEVANMLMSCSDECEAVAKAIMAASPKDDLSDVKSIYQWYCEYYGEDIVDNRDQYHCMRTNKSYKGLVHPTKAVEGGFVPDFTNRYLTEDVPMGVVVFKGLALAAGVPTPNHDKLIYWAQEKIGKEYLVNGQLTGKDVASTRCPQRYGFNTLSAILTGKN
ncbi:octopine dehydrogenase-like [Lineus longissimus]|uniref:octopine dehydrogenase-like n=1 Tax=Lineus longissimus TaxID=88925 RepID=UPI002B4D5ECD